MLDVQDLLSSIPSLPEILDSRPLPPGDPEYDSFQVPDLENWAASPDGVERSGSTATAMVAGSTGLFPRPVSLSVDSGAAARLLFRQGVHWNLLGQLLGHSLMDGWLLDLPLAPTFFLLLQEPRFHPSSPGECVKSVALLQTLPKMLTHIRAHVDPGLGEWLIRLQELAEQHAEPQERSEPLTLDGSSIEDLCLDFTLPGHPDIQLVPVSRLSFFLIHHPSQVSSGDPSPLCVRFKEM